MTDTREGQLFVGTPTEYAEPGSGVTLASLAASVAGKVNDGELVYNVKKLGAFGLTSCVVDGVTDDGPAFNALITAICNDVIPNAPIFLGIGTLATSVPLDLPYFSDKIRTLHIYGVSRNNSIILALGSTSTPFQAVIRHLQPRDSVTTVPVVSAGGAHHLHDFRIDCAAKAKFGILLINAHAVNVHNVFVKHAAPQSVAGEPTAEIKITGQGTDYLSWEHHIGPNIRLEGGATAGATASTYGLWVNSSDNTIEDVVSLRHDLNANDGADFCNSSGNNFWGQCHTFYSEAGYYAKGLAGAGSVFSACEADNPTLKGWRVESSNTQIVGCKVFWAGTAPGTVNGIDIRWDVTGVVITGNSVWDESGAWPTARGLINQDKLGANCVVRGNAGISVTTSAAGSTQSFQLANQNDGVYTAIGGSAVDLQFVRSATTDVASGTASFAAGGRNEASGLYAVAIGQQNTAKTDYSVSTGNRSTALGVRGKRQHAAGRFAVSGDQQYSDVPVAAITTSTASTRLRSNASGTSAGNISLLQPTVASSACVTVRMSGFCASTGDAVAWRIEALVTKAAALNTVAVIGSPAWVTIGGTTTGLTAVPTFGVDTTLGGYAVSVVAPDTNTWHWVARIDSVEIA